MKATIHQTVLLNETIDGLIALQSFGKAENKELLILDATFGGGGHSKEILERYPNAKVIALDQDKGVWEKAKDKFKGMEDRIFFVNANFRDLDKNFLNINSSGLTLPGIPGGTHTVQNLYPENFFNNFSGKLDGIIFDLGLSSDQLENSGRGFSFMKDEPLLMTMKENPLPEDLTAIDIVNTWSEKSLADIIYGYGEERFSRRIAKGIAEERKKKRIETTFELVKVIESSVPGPYKRGRMHFATKTFQALRIAVNDELGSLEEGLKKGFEVLKKGGRMSVISFHSLEDRIVKRFFREKVKSGEAIFINKKPIIPKDEEIKSNPRSRSAKLRILSRN